MSCSPLVCYTVPIYMYMYLISMTYMYTQRPCAHADFHSFDQCAHSHVHAIESCARSDLKSGRLRFDSLASTASTFSYRYSNIILLRTTARCTIYLKLMRRHCCLRALTLSSSLVYLTMICTHELVSRVIKYTHTLTHSFMILNQLDDDSTCPVMLP